jgi:hypothetical protein
MEVFPWFLHYLVQLWDETWHICSFTLALSKHIFCFTISTLKMSFLYGWRGVGQDAIFLCLLYQLPSTGTSFVIIQGPPAGKLHSYSIAKHLFWTYYFTVWKDFDISWDYCPSSDIAFHAHKHEDNRDESLYL